MQCEEKEATHAHIAKHAQQKHRGKVQVTDQQHGRTTCVTVWSPGMTCSPASSFTCCETAASTGSADNTAATHSTHEPIFFVNDHASRAGVLLDATCGSSNSRSKGKGFEGVQNGLLFREEIWVPCRKGKAAVECRQLRRISCCQQLLCHQLAALHNRLVPKHACYCNSYVAQ